MTEPVPDESTGRLTEGSSQRAEIIRALRRLCQGTARQLNSPIGNHSGLSTGISALDALLPDQGLQPGWLIEWLSPVAGGEVAVLALQGIQPALQGRSVWAVVDETGEFYPPAVQGWGISLEKLLWLRPASIADAAWSVEQLLRCPAVGLTWFQTERIPDRVLQRWKIAAEVGGGVGVLFRPAKAARNASWADVRWLVQPQPRLSLSRGRRIRVELLFCRGACRPKHCVELEVCDATGDVRLVPAVASTATAS